MTVERRLLTYKEAAECMGGISEDLLRDLVRHGRLPVVSVGSKKIAARAAPLSCHKHAGDGHQRQGGERDVGSRFGFHNFESVRTHHPGNAPRGDGQGRRFALTGGGS